MPIKMFSSELKKSPKFTLRFPSPPFSIPTIPLVAERFSFHCKNDESGDTLTKKLFEIFLKELNMTRENFDNSQKGHIYNLLKNKSFTITLEIGMCKDILNNEKDLIIRRQIKNYLNSLQENKRGKNVK